MVSESNFEFCCGGADILELAFFARGQIDDIFGIAS